MIKFLFIISVYLLFLNENCNAQPDPCEISYHYLKIEKIVDRHKSTKNSKYRLKGYSPGSLGNPQGWNENRDVNCPLTSSNKADYIVASPHNLKTTYYIIRNRADTMKITAYGIGSSGTYIIKKLRFREGDFVMKVTLLSDLAEMNRTRSKYLKIKPGFITYIKPKAIIRANKFYKRN